MFQKGIGRKTLSLIEVGVAVFVFALLATGMLGVFNQGFNAALKTKERTVAWNIACSIMEVYSDWNSLETLAGSPPSNGSYTNPPNPITLNGITYSPTVTISDGPVGPSSELKQIDVTVNWDTESVRLVSLVAVY
ncbi:hypothetical protein DRO38_04365 [Candidatus Bathyarchaeota archaeon]|nr:MAG: hypothetical protein DRO38_04365 [Candidatus Bathyarchaeota archaeon]